METEDSGALCCGCGGRELLNVSLSPVYLLVHIEISGVSAFKGQSWTEPVFGAGPKTQDTELLWLLKFHLCKKFPSP